MYVATVNILGWVLGATGDKLRRLEKRTFFLLKIKLISARHPGFHG